MNEINNLHVDRRVSYLPTEGASLGVSGDSGSSP